MANYLVSHYKNKYRIRTEYNKSTNTFSRKLDGTFEDIDCYIDCYNNIQIFYYGKRLLECYVPSIIRGHNIIKAIKQDFGDNIIFDIEETDSEVLFKFHSKDMDKLEKYLKPKTSGASISPFSSKNLPKSDYTIPDEDLNIYKKVIENVPENQRITIAHMTKSFLQSLVTKKNTWEDIKADIALKCMDNKSYIHTIGQWANYIRYLEDNLCQI